MKNAPLKDVYVLDCSTLLPGPYALAPGHDVNYQGMSGLLSLSGDPEKGTEFPDGFQVADLSPTFAFKK